MLVVLEMNLFFATDVTDLTDFNGFYLIELTAMRFLWNDNFVDVNIKNQCQLVQSQIAQIFTNFHNFETFRLYNFMTIFLLKKNVKSSPDRADILPQSRRAREIKAKAGRVVN